MKNTSSFNNQDRLADLSSNLNDKEFLHLYEEIKDEEKAEFQIKNSVSREVEILSMEKLYSPTLKINFEKRSANKLVTYAWLHGNEILSKDLEGVKTNGLEISNRNHFVVGSLFSDDLSEEDLNDKEHEYILCKVIVGNSFCKIYDDKDEIEGFIVDEMDNFPKNQYDSIMFCNREFLNYKSNKFGIQKRYIYKILDKYNVLPLSLVTFKIIPENKVICEECNNEAFYYCYNCSSDFCEKCFNEIHEKLKEANHRKKSYTSNRFGVCNCDYKLDIEFYCEDCKRCLCSRCKFFGDHSDKLASSHNLLTIEEAKKVFDPDKNNETVFTLKTEKNKIKAQIDNYISISRRLNKNSKDVIEKNITDAFSVELREVNFKTMEKLKKCISSMNQLVVNRDFCRYIHNYFLEKEAIVKEIYSSEFIWIWNLRKKMVKNILENNLKGIIDKIEITEPLKVNFESDTKTTVSIVEFVVENNVIISDNRGKDTKNRTDDKKIKLYDAPQSLTFIESTKRILNANKNKKSDMNNSNTFENDRENSQMKISKY